MQPLTVESLTAARAAVLENASALLADALYLLNGDRFARSFALTVLAREEMAKLAMLIRASYALKSSESFDWNRLGRRMTAHPKKLTLYALIEIINSTNAARVHDPKIELLRLLNEPENRSKLNEGKQDGFYVSITDQGTTRPADVIDDDRARTLYLDTRSMLEFFRTGEATDPETSVFGGIQDIYGKIVCLAEDLIASPESVVLPR